MNKWLLGVIAGLFALLALGASIVIPFLVLSQATDKLAHLQIPLLALSGFLGILACVGLLVLAFNAMGLGDQKQSLGLPEGSVRALIAIFLIVTLGMTALFLLGPQKQGNAAKPGTPPASQARSDIPAMGQAAFRFAADPPAPAGGTSSGPTQNQDGGDLSKQFLTMLGGLVTTIIGFYFGAQTANSASARAVEAMKHVPRQPTPSPGQPAPVPAS
jgi:hypothetical protein